MLAKTRDKKSIENTESKTPTSLEDKTPLSNKAYNIRWVSSGSKAVMNYSIIAPACVTK